MKNIFAQIAATTASSVAFSVAIAASPAQAIDFNFNWLGDAGYSAIGSFSYDEATAPTIISESGAGATNFLQSLSVSFLARSAEAPHSLLGVWDECAGVERYSN